MDGKELTTVTPFVFNVQKIMEQAIAAGTGVEVMEKLLQMRNLMKAEAAKEAYNIALSEFQAECPRIIKGKDVIGNNNKKRYSYAPLDDIVEQVKGLLKKHGFSYSFDATFADNAQTITCSARHIGGHSETATFRAPVDKDAYMSEVQKHGAAMTFAKRYAFCQVFGIMTGDEDTDGAGQNGNGKPEPPPANNPADINFMTAIKKELDKLIYILGETAGTQTYKNMLAGIGYKYADEITDRATREAAYKGIVELVRQAKEQKAKNIARDKAVNDAINKSGEPPANNTPDLKQERLPGENGVDPLPDPEPKLSEAQQKFSDLLMQTVANQDEFARELIRLTSFVGRNGKLFEGYWHVGDMSDNAADVSRHRLEAEIKAREGQK